MEPTAEQREQLMRHGYIILRGMIPPDEVAELRKSVDAIIERAPPQSRVDLTRWVDRETASGVEFFVDDRVFEFSQKLMNAPDVVGHGMWILRQADTGWHRDIHTYHMVPLDGLQEDIRLNGPPYLQWNIALYDDPYFHFIPASHLRRNNEHENKIERRDGAVPLPGMTCLDLKAGDGSVYINAMLHCAKPSGENNE